MNQKSRLADLAKIVRSDRVPVDEVGGQKDTQVIEIDCSKITPSRFQFRKYFDADFIAQLAEQYLKNPEAIAPVLVRPLEKSAEGKEYELIYGEQRLRSCITAGRKTIRASITNADDWAALEMGWDENTFRRDFNPYEQIEGFLAILAYRLETSSEEVISLMNKAAKIGRGSISDDGLLASQEWQVIVDQTDRKLGMTVESFRTHKLPILNVPDEIKEALGQGKIRYNHARAIANIPDPVMRANLLEEAIEQNLSVRTIQERAKELKIQDEEDNRYVPTRALKSRLGDIRKLMRPERLQDPAVLAAVEESLDQIEKLLSAGVDTQG